jgi:pimeloyl-ACP methyl ester carboxylesterase
VNSLLRVLALFAALPYVIIAGLVLTGVASWSAILYVLALGTLLGGLATLPLDGDGAAGERVRTRRRPRGVSRAAAGAMAAIALVRACTAATGRTLRVPEVRAEGAADSADLGRGRSTHADLSGARFVDRYVDESDLAVAGTRALVATGMLHDDARELPGAMRSAYARFRAEEGDVPSPVLATYLGLERASAFDLVLVDVDPRGPAADAALVFLHGFGGGFDLPCWQLARAVGPLGVATVCPAIGWQGDWASPGGEATLRRTLEVLRARGIERVVLAGLSNGGLGASELAPRMQGAFVGLVLVSGAERRAPPAGVPTLVLHGRHDTMTSFDDARAYAERTGARFVDLDAGHFAMLVRGAEVDRAIREFVAARLARGSDILAR